MLEPPNLPHTCIIIALRDSYNLAVTGVEFLSIGNDSTAWVYRVEVGSETYFLKLRLGVVNEASLSVPRYLLDQGIAQVVAPYPTHTQRLYATVDAFNLILYPFIEGDTGWAVGLSDTQYAEFGAVVKRIHSVSLNETIRTHLRQETFIPKCTDMIKQLQTDVRQREYTDPLERGLAAFWRERQDEISRIVERTDELARLARERVAPFVLCHADIHIFNVLVTPQGKLFIVDWDETLLAPKEHDLMFVGGAAIGGNDVARETELFYRGYGQTKIDPLILAYYRYEWVSQEIGDYGLRVFAMTDIGEETRREAVAASRKLFAPSDVVEAAYAADNLL